MFNYSTIKRSKIHGCFVNDWSSYLFKKYLCELFISLCSPFLTIKPYHIIAIVLQAFVSIRLIQLVSRNANLAT